MITSKSKSDQRAEADKAVFGIGRRSRFVGDEGSRRIAKYSGTASSAWTSTLDQHVFNTQYHRLKSRLIITLL
jgi:hypothetical protein